MTQTAIPCTLMRGGTSKGLYFRAIDLPADAAIARDVRRAPTDGDTGIALIAGAGGIGSAAQSENWGTAASSG